MRWLKRGRWRAGITLAGLLLLLVLMVWAPVSASAYEGASGFAGPGTVTLQTPSTPDLTVTAVVQDQLKQQDEKARRDNSGIWPLLNALGGSIGTIFLAIAAVIGTIFGFTQWRGNQNAERRKEITAQDKELRDREDARRREAEAQDKDLRAQAEERFKTAIAALGDEKESVQVGGAILLRSFLNPEDEKIYGRYYTQIFDLAVAYLRTPPKYQAPKDPDVIASKRPPLTTLRQALIVVFKEAFPLARDQNKGSPQSLDATGIQLDDAFLSVADLRQVWMPKASLDEANLSEAHLDGAYLNGTSLYWTDFNGAVLFGAKLNGANLSGANLRKADLRKADFRWADLRQAKLDGALLNGTILHRASNGLTEDQLKAYKAEGAVIDESRLSSLQSTVLPLVPSQSNSSQAPAVPPVQVSPPPPNTDGSSSASSQPSTQP